MASGDSFPVRIPPGGGLDQPWQALAPWTRQGPVYEALREQYAEILQWVFSSDNIFDTSYRRLVTLDPPPVVQQPLPARSRPHVAPSEIQLARQGLDELIRRSNLPSTPTGLYYLAPLDIYRREKVFRLQVPRLHGIQTSNLAVSNYQVPIYDVSDHDSIFKLDESGFEYTKCDVEVKGWTDEYIQTDYLPQLLDWLKKYLGCQSSTIVIPYSYNFRHQNHGDSFVPVHRCWDSASRYVRHPPSHPETPAGGPSEDRNYCLKAFLAQNRWDEPYNGIGQVKQDAEGPCFWKEPLFRVHGDASPNTPKHRLWLCRPQDHETLLETRTVRMFSIWRQLTTAEQATPLALCDMRTTDPGDFARIDIVHPHFVDEATEVYHNPAHRWFFKRNMDLDDVVIFKLHDGDALQKGVTTCPHSAFADPNFPGHRMKRASIEVKFMVLDEKK